MPYERDPSIPPGLSANTYLDMPNRPVLSIVDPAFDKVLRTHERVHWSLTEFVDELKRDIEADPNRLVTGNGNGQAPDTKLPQFHPELTTDEEVKSLQSTMLIESHNPVFGSNLLGWPINRMDFRETAFLARIWIPEEFQHFQGQLSYLEALSVAREVRQDPRIPRVDIQAVAQKLAIVRAGEHGSRERDFTKVQANTFEDLQEFFTWDGYMKRAQEAKDPMLKYLYLVMGHDEMRHHSWFHNRVSDSLHPDPERPDYLDPSALEEFVGMLMMFYFPGERFIPDFNFNTSSLAGKNDTDQTVKQLVGKVEDLVGPNQLDQILSRKDFQNSITARGIAPAKIMGLRMARKLRMGS